MKRLCIPLPEVIQEEDTIDLMFREQGCLCEEETEPVVQQLEGFSGLTDTAVQRGPPWSHL